MDFLTLVKVVLHRWRVVLPLLILSGIVTLWFVSSVPPTYRASGNVLLASPGGRVDPAAPQVNPFTNLDYTASVVAKIVADLMQDKAVAERLVQSGADPGFTITAADSTPQLLIESTTESPKLSIDTVRIVIEGVQSELAQRQKDAGAPAETWVRALILSSPTRADRLIAGKIKALLALTAVSLTGAVSMALLVESASESRRRGTPRPDPVPVPLALGPAEGRTEGVRARSEVRTEGVSPRFEERTQGIVPPPPEDRTHGISSRRPENRTDGIVVPRSENRTDGIVVPRSQDRAQVVLPRHEGLSEGAMPGAQDRTAGILIPRPNGLTADVMARAEDRPEGIVPPRPDGLAEGVMPGGQGEQETGRASSRARVPHPAAGVREFK